jgi:hypothetical protein
MAADLQSLEQRVIALEKAVSELQTRVGVGPADPTDTPSWITRMAVSDVEAFKEVCRLGREFRKTGRCRMNPATSHEIPNHH